MEKKTFDIKQIIQKAGPLRIGIVIVCGVLLVFLSCGDGFQAKKETETVGQTTVQESETSTNDSYKQRMEQELMELLGKVQGVGKAEVMLTIKASNEKVTLKDNSNKGETTEEETVLVEDSDNNSAPYVVQEKEPEIEGIVVVCDGGDNAAIKREITEAVSALFQIESHKIKIMKGKEAKE